MRKLFLLTCLMLSMLTFAQETKRVAILETVDKQGNVSYANKLILRSNLAKAITNTPGYEAYDRTDMDAIMGEQDFQRTGMVSSDQIKRLGEMTGAKYVLVAEAALVDEHNMYITAKLLDVETARTEITDNQMMGTTAKEIQRGCQLLASKMIKPVIAEPAKETKSAKTSKAKKEETIKQEKVSKEEKQVVAKQEKPAPAPKAEKKPADGLTGSLIIKVSNDEYRLGTTTMDREAYEQFIYKNCADAWQKHLHAKGYIAGGWACLGVGIAACAGWSLLPLADYFYEGKNPTYYITADTRNKWRTAGLIIGSVGAGLTVVSIPLLIGGHAAKNNTHKTYNKRCTDSVKPSMSLNVQANQNGLGLAFLF